MEGNGTVEKNTGVNSCWERGGGGSLELFSNLLLAVTIYLSVCTEEQAMPVTLN